METVSWQFCLFMWFGEEVLGKEYNFLFFKNQTLILSLKLRWYGKQKKFVKPICNPCREKSTRGHNAVLKSTDSEAMTAWVPITALSLPALWPWVPWLLTEMGKCSQTGQLGLVVLCYKWAVVRNTWPNTYKVLQAVPGTCKYYASVSYYYFQNRLLSTIVFFFKCILEGWRRLLAQFVNP